MMKATPGQMLSLSQDHESGVRGSYSVCIQSDCMIVLSQHFEYYTELED